jgi:hypothetical protein
MGEPSMVERAFPNALIEVSEIGFGGIATMGVLCRAVLNLCLQIKPYTNYVLKFCIINFIFISYLFT